MSDKKFSEKISIKYSDNVPDNYLSELQFTFYFVNLVFKENKSIDEAIKKTAVKYGLSRKYLNTYLIENNYILNKTKRDEFSNQLKDYNTKKLKKILKKNNLKTSGKRKKIEERLFENNLLKQNWYLSSKSRIFHKNKKRRSRIFDEYLSERYYFIEFNEFYMDNYRKKEAKIPVEYINTHIAKSIEDENHRIYIMNNQILANHFLKKENYRKMLESVLRIYCMSLNPIWKIDELKNHEGILENNYNDLLFLKDKLSKNIIISNYYLVWDSFNFEKIILSKYEGYRYLKTVLNAKDLNNINNDLNRNFYANDDLKIKKITQKTLFDF